MDLEFKKKQSVLTKYHIDPDTKKPTSVPVIEKQQVHPLKNLIQMVGEVKKNKKIQIIDRDMIPVNKPEKITQPYHYYVDYEQNLIHFHPDVAGQTIEYKYEDMGVTVISANKIFTKQDEKGNVIELLEDIIRLGREAIDVMETIGGVAIVMKRLEDDIKEGYEVSRQIQDDIQQAKDEVINVQSNKEVIIKASEWILNGDGYEKEITHTCNSENLHVTAKNSDTKEATTIGYKILDKTRILLKSDEAINMSVILSASYYHATQTISDNIAEEVVKARKGETGLDVKITKIEEELDTIENKANLANSKYRLTTVSAYDDIDSYHPKILRFNPKWNGYYYWMAFTPYPNGDQAKENPHILASNNMLTWVEPEGYKNPLEPQPSGDATKQYYSDTHLVFREDLQRLECWWRYCDDDLDKLIIYRKITTDGVNWTEKEVMIEETRSITDRLSPALIWEDNMYKMWYVDKGYVVKYSESVDGKTWINTRQLNITYDKSNMNNWHLDVIKSSKGYEMLLSSFETGQNRNDMDLYYTKSSDNVNWDTCITILKHSNDPFSWDNRGIYRSSFLIKDGLYYVFYSATSTKGTKGIGITYGKDISNLKGIENNDMYIFNNAKAFNMVFNAFLRNYALQLTSPRTDGSLWSGCLAHHNSTDMKLIEKFGGEVFKNLILNALKTYEGVIFQGKSAYYKANEFKIYEQGKAAIMGIGEANYFKPIRNDETRKTGGFEVSAIKFEDIGISDDMLKEGTVRYSNTSKQLLLYNGTSWVPLN